MDETDKDDLPALAGLLGIPEPELRSAIGGPWHTVEAGPGPALPFTTFTGLANPRTPGRPLVAMRVEHEDGTLVVGYAVGVPVPTGEMRWALAEPRTELMHDADDPGDGFLLELRDAVQRVADAAMLRGTSW